MALLTTTAGALPKPVELRRARWKHEEGDLDSAALREIEDRATREAVEWQAASGLDLLTDGQMDRGDLVSHFAERLEGVERGGLVRCYGNRYTRRPRIVGALMRPKPIALERWRAAQALTERPVKAIVTGPYTLMDWSFDEHYASREECCLALAAIVRAEVEDLVEAGAKEVQVDELALDARPEEIGLVRESLARALEPAKGKARTWVRLGYCDLGPVLQEALTLPGDGIMLALANADAALTDALGALPEGKWLGAGVVDSVDPAVEEPEEIARRIERVLARVPASRLIVHPDTGLGALAPATAKRKLEHLVGAARRF